MGRETPVVLKTCRVAGCCHVLALMILLALPLPASLLLRRHKSTLMTGGVPILSTPRGGRIRLTGVVGLEGTVPQTLARWVAVLRRESRVRETPRPNVRVASELIPRVVLRTSWAEGCLLVILARTIASVVGWVRMWVSG